MIVLMDNLVNIEEYKSPNILLPNKFYSFTLILVILIIVLISLLFFKYEYYYKGIGIVTEECIIETKISYTDSYKLLDNNKLTINKNKFSYKIKAVSVPVIENDIPYQSIVIEVDKLNNPSNSIVEFKIRYDDKYGFEIIKELVFGKE